MGNTKLKRIGIIFVVLILFILSAAGTSHASRQIFLQEIISKLEKMRDRESAEIKKYDVEIQKCEAIIESSEMLIKKAREQGNAKAEQIARSAQTTAQEARKRNKELKGLAESNWKRVETALDHVKRNGADPEARLEQVEFENMNDRWVQKQKQLIEQRLKDPNPYASEIIRSLKTKAPPPLPPTKYDELLPGDILLISPKEASFWARFRDQSYWINWGDRITTDLESPASHTVLYLKDVNGKKLFLDHTLGRGSQVISETEFLRTYGDRDALVASLAKPLRKSEADNIWVAAKELIKNEAAIQGVKSGNPVDRAGYGLYGNDNMVCSEASRWALIKAGRDIPESASPLKRLLGIHYGPANFFSDDYNFIITPMWEFREK